MLLDEFVDFRVRAGESGRQEVERERARRADEHGRWLRGMRAALTRAEGRAAGGAAAAAAEVAGAPVTATEGGAGAPLPATTTTAQPAPATASEPIAAAPERELAHAAR